MISDMAKESVLQTKILKYLKDVGGYAVNQHGSAMSSKGTPDILACYKGRFIAIETKVGYNKCSPAQELHHARIKKAGGAVIVPYTIEEFIKEWELITNGL